MQYTMTTLSNASTQNALGEWVPSIPLPMFLVLHCRCECGQRFLRLRNYQGHYAHAHILGMA
jgi:hypothetical protein